MYHEVAMHINSQFEVFGVVGDQLTLQHEVDAYQAQLKLNDYFGLSGNERGMLFAGLGDAKGDLNEYLRAHPK